MHKSGYSGDGLTCTPTADAGAAVWRLVRDGGFNDPSPRRGAGLAYDAVYQEMVLFGGYTGSVYAASTWSYAGDTWEYGP